MKLNFITFVFILLYSSKIWGQNNRLNVYNSIGWYNCFGTIKLNSKINLHTEYQWRRNHYVNNWQQSLLRVGFNHNINNQVLIRIGYSWVETFAYGEIPLNSFGKDFTEHRLFEMLQLAHKENGVDFTHRFMLEQRFVGKYSSSTAQNEDEFPLLNRVRYMFRVQSPLKGKTIGNDVPYIAIYDEIFIGFGKNVNTNIFDQNRIGLLLGYYFNKKARLELGYLNQTLQLGRLVNTKNVFQNNNGIIVNSIFNFDLQRK